VIKGVSLEISKGSQAALIGLSGAGKSTIAALLLQLYKPVGGQILFDNKPADEYPMQALRKNMAFVPQEVILFGGTIRENIAYGKPEASQEEVQRAAEQANAMEFISKFPEGMETLVGDRGVQLSGGQRQRIAIARAILRNPRILILDEATSSLDSESEKLVQDALKTLMQGRTSFVIAHRLSTIRNANQILVLQQGKIVEHGTHDVLLSIAGGVYKNLVQIQQAG
jgi:ABC-type multidrug transport system fused ATPase/permease subunit